MLPATVCITVDGIPAKAEVTDYRYFKGSYKADNPEDYYDQYEIKYKVYDRKGYYSPWLEEKINKDSLIEEDVYRQIIEEIEIIQENL